MTDQTTPEPLTDEETLPLSSSDQARRLLAEIDRLRAHRDQLRAETLRLGISLAEAIHERRQLRTDLAGAERYRTAALAVAADLTDDLAEARAEIERRDVRWDELVEEKNRLIEDFESLRAQLDAADRLRCCVCDTSLGYTNYIRQQFCGPCANGETPAQEPATATPAPDPDPSEGPAPTSRPRPAQGTEPLTLAQAASALHDWAGDLDDGANTDWPHGHPDIIRGIRAAADWLDARDKYETEARQQAADDYRTASIRAVVDDIMRMRQAVIQAAGPEETPEPAEPTLRDVMAAAYRAGLRLRYEVDDPETDGNGKPWRHREYAIAPFGDDGESGRVILQVGADWTNVVVSGADGEPSVRLDLPTPRKILAAAELAGLIGGGTDA